MTRARKGAPSKGGRMKTVIRVTLWLLGGSGAILATVAGVYVFNNLTSFDRDMAAVSKAGFVEKQTMIDGHRLNYGEGPDNGPALLLIHGHIVDWKNYAKVLPELATSFHVFAVDCYGHGASDRVPEKYSAKALGADLSRFIKEVIGEPVLLSGHSGGGLLTVWLAANAPEDVRGIVLEDPPLFTTLLPRALKTWNYVDISTSAHGFLQSGQTDFVAYNAQHGRLVRLVDGFAPTLIKDSLAYHSEHPADPVKIYYAPPQLNELFRGLHRYDPRYGEAFYTGSWDEGFDHADALARIAVPAVLIHANWEYDADGILRAAMDDKDAERARSLLKTVEFIRVDSGHGFHYEKPKDFVRILQRFRTQFTENGPASALRPSAPEK